MSGPELRIKRVSARISGVVLCMNAGIGRTRLSGIERGTIAVTAEEAARIESVLDQLIRARGEANKLAISMGWPTVTV